jgi:hypothetical protein
MATRHDAPEDDAHGEGHSAFHLPPPSIWPVVLAVGIALLLTGLILNIVIVLVGAIVVIASIGLWVRDARREFGDLPE